MTFRGKVFELNWDSFLLRVSNVGLTTFSQTAHIFFLEPSCVGKLHWVIAMILYKWLTGLLSCYREIVTIYARLLAPILVNEMSHGFNLVLDESKIYESQLIFVSASYANRVKGLALEIWIRETASRYVAVPTRNVRNINVYIALLSQRELDRRRNDQGSTTMCRAAICRYLNSGFAVSKQCRDGGYVKCWEHSVVVIMKF